MNRKQQILGLVITGLSAASLIVCGSILQELTEPNIFGIPPAVAQVPAQASLRSSEVWRQVYQQLPYLPLENQYVSKDTGKRDPNSTLISRLIRYHIYEKGRPTKYRLDWKLTLADYLGVNEKMEEGLYPGADTLRQNPLDGDRAAIDRLNLKQRDALVQVLVNIFNPINQATSSKTPSQVQTSTPDFVQPQPGSAHLLLP